MEKRGCLAGSVEIRPQRLVVDLGGCPLVDAAAIGVLLQAHRAMVHAGGRLVLRHPAGRVRHILRLAKIYQVFDIDDEADAVLLPGS